MPDNPHIIAPHWFFLPDHGVVAFSGRDATAFLQAQTMNDVAVLRDGDWHWNGWLTAKGRVIALFALVRLTSDTYWLLLPDADIAALADALRRFVFRSKVAIEARTDLRVAGRLAASTLASGGHWIEDRGAVELDMSGAPGAHGRSLRIGAPLDAIEDADAMLRWRAEDLAHGLPRLEAAQREQWTPQQLSLERLRAFSVKKGCYPGQEIVARTHFLGQAKRGLARIRSDVPLAAGVELPVAEGASPGVVVSAAGNTALAVVANDAPVSGIGWRSEPLLDGLAR